MEEVPWCRPVEPGRSISGEWKAAGLSVEAPSLSGCFILFAASSYLLCSLISPSSRTIVIWGHDHSAMLLQISRPSGHPGSIHLWSRALSHRLFAWLAHVQIQAEGHLQKKELICNQRWKLPRKPETHFPAEKGVHLREARITDAGRMPPGYPVVLNPRPCQKNIRFGDPESQYSLPVQIIILQPGFLCTGFCPSDKLGSLARENIWQSLKVVWKWKKILKCTTIHINHPLLMAHHWFIFCFP